MKMQNSILALKKCVLLMFIFTTSPVSAVQECEPIECLERAIVAYKKATERIESLETKVKKLEGIVEETSTSKGLIGGFLNGCPKPGWKQLDDLQGRFLVGVGNNGNRNRENTQDSAAVIEDIKPNTFGGIMDQKLNSHVHSFRDTYHAEHPLLAQNWPHEDLKTAVVGSAGTDEDNINAFYIDKSTGASGSLTPTTVRATNYPPFFSVYWCEKT